MFLAAAFLKRGHDPQVAALAKGAQDLALHALRWHPLVSELGQVDAPFFLREHELDVGGL